MSQRGGDSVSVRDTYPRTLTYLPPLPRLEWSDMRFGRKGDNIILELDWPSNLQLMTDLGQDRLFMFGVAFTSSLL